MIEVQRRKHFDSLLGQLQEGAGELVTEISKAKRFGLHEKYTPEHPTNLQRVINEVKDLVSIANIIQEVYDIDFGVEILDDEYLSMKKEKVIFYEELSERLGLLELEENYGN